MKEPLKTFRKALGGLILVSVLWGCTGRTARVQSAEYHPRPHLTISIIDPSKVLVHHSRGAMLFDPRFGIGGEGIFPDAPYNGFSRSLDVYGDGSVVLVPITERAQFRTGMIVNLPSGRKILFTEQALLRQHRANSRVTVFALSEHKFHESIAHCPDFEN